MKNKNLIMGVAKGYSFNKIKPFIISLKRTGFKGDLVLFVSKIDKRTEESLKQYNVKLIPYNDEFHHLKGFSDKEKLLPKGHPHKMSPNCYRYILYYLYLSKYSNKYSKIMLTDVRDVVFQRDPFDFEINDELCCFLEDKKMTIKSCRFNSNWIKQAFGDEILEEIGNNYISCSGTIFGNFSHIMDYLKKMVSILMQISTRYDVDNYYKNGMDRMDQGVHNYLIYKNLLKDLKLIENEKGPVLTMFYKARETVHFNGDGFVINDAGDIVPVVHQYTHHPEVQEKFYEKFHR